MANGNNLFAGRALGKRDYRLFDETRQISLKWLAVMALLLGGYYWAGSDFFLAIFTTNATVLSLAHDYNFYLIIYPLCDGLGLPFYGLYTGATHTAPIRDMMFLSRLCFLTTRHLLISAQGNSGLWTSYLIFYFAQFLIMLASFPRLRRKFEQADIALGENFS